MKNLIAIFLFIPSFLFSQEFSFDVNTNEGYIEIIYILDNNKVFKISETIDEIYVFSSDSIAKNYLQTLNHNIIPKNKYQLGLTTIFLNSVSSVDYYTNDSPSGSSGQIKSINDLIFTYAVRVQTQTANVFNEVSFYPKSRDVLISYCSYTRRYG